MSMYVEDETREGYIRDQIKSQIKEDSLDIPEHIDINIISVAPDDMIVLNIKQDFGDRINYEQIHQIMSSIQERYPNNKVIAIKDKILEADAVSPSWIDGLIQQLIHAYPGDKTKLLDNIVRNIKGEPSKFPEEEQEDVEE